MSKRGLGRGFDSLIPTELLDESFDPTATQDGSVSELRQVKLSEIIPDPNQPRRQFDEDGLAELASSIAQHGILQPIVLTPHAGQLMIVAGERRFRAAKLAGLERIPALVRTLSDQHRLEVSLIENLQRRDLNPLETATAYLKLRDQFNLTLEQIGQRVGGRSNSTISNTIRLLRLAEPARTALHEGQLSEGQARPLIGLETEVLEVLVPRIIRESWNVRQIEQFIVDRKKAAAEKKPETTRTPAPKQDSETLTKALNTPVSIRTSTKGSGQIIIAFRSAEELERIQSLLEK